MTRRTPKTKASPLGEELRKTAVAYKASGVPEGGSRAAQDGRAEGLLDAAARVDAWFQKNLPGPLTSERFYAALSGVGSQVQPIPADLTRRVEALGEELGNLAALIASAAQPKMAPLNGTAPSRLKDLPAILRPPVKVRETSRTRAPSGDLTKCERTILTALVQMHRALPEDTLLLLTGYAKSGSWTQAIGSLRRRDFVEGSARGMGVTEFGMEAIGRVEPLPTGPALVSYWETKLGACAGAILRLMLQNEELDEADARSALEYAKSGSWTQAVGKLRRLSLLTPRGALRVPDEARRLLVDS